MMNCRVRDNQNASQFDPTDAANQSGHYSIRSRPLGVKTGQRHKTRTVILAVLPVRSTKSGFYCRRRPITQVNQPLYVLSAVLTKTVSRYQILMLVTRA
jgi:hypothetical protein